MSEQCTALSTKRYLPQAEEFSNASTCALATSLTSISLKVAFGNVLAPASNKGNAQKEALGRLANRNRRILQIQLSVVYEMYLN